MEKANLNIKCHNMFGFVQILITKIPNREELFPKYKNNTFIKLYSNQEFIINDHC